MSVNHLFKPRRTTKGKIREILLFIAWFQQAPVMRYAEIVNYDFGGMPESELEIALTKLEFLRDTIDMTFAKKIINEN